MIVTIIKSGALAISPREVVIFSKGDKFKEGDKNLTLENLKRLVELNLATFDNKDIIIKEEKIEFNDFDISIENDTLDEIDTFTDKDDLIEYAKEIYSVNLDKRKTLEKLKETLKLAIKE
jgi:hypothetical protein